jgi:hypothetical protein
MKAAALVFPHQLFVDNPCLKRARIVSLVEDQWFFQDRFSVHQRH